MCSYLLGVEVTRQRDNSSSSPQGSWGTHLPSRSRLRTAFSTPSEAAAEGVQPCSGATRYGQVMVVWPVVPSIISSKTNVCTC